MAYDPRKVVLEGFPIDDFTFTYNITGTVAQTDLGKAMTQDTTADGAMKLAGDGDPVEGRLFSYEDRSQQGAGKVGGVQRKFRERLPVKAGLTGFNVPARGDTVVGAGAGEVKALNDGSAKTPNHSLNQVIAVGTDYVIVERL